MVKLNFEQFRLPIGVSGKNERTGDVRESFADIVYMSATGVKAHHLAFKIYESNGAIEYSDEEVTLIVATAEHYCTPSFIDGLKRQIENNPDNKQQP